MLSMGGERMSRQKSPYVKKQEEYDKDRYALAEYPTWFRRHWPKKKARLNRQERRKINEIVHTTTKDAHVDELSVALLNAAKPTHNTKKWGACTLREIVDAKLQRRKETRGARTKRHGQSITLLQGEGEKS
jgi:hypothetical protein